MSIKLTKEQEKVIDEALKGNNILVDACIGSGKTTTIQEFCNRIDSKKKILYLTYNKLLKIDAKSKIKQTNAYVTNYHGFAFVILLKNNIRASVPELIQEFNKNDIIIPKFDILLIDEYQDIDTELSIMISKIVSVNPKMQIIAVGDMDQKIYDKTTLNVREYINSLLGKHINLSFTYCFRLNKDYASKLGRIWNKKINGVNDNNKILYLDFNRTYSLLKSSKPSDVLCLGSRSGKLVKMLNKLESECSSIYNKKTVYASISDNNSFGAVEPNESTAIFTTFDSSKGLERKICVIFDYTESYWDSRITKPNQAYDILKNIFLVASSRGKEQIIFVTNSDSRLNDPLLSEETISNKPQLINKLYKDIEISNMYNFKYQEDIEACYKELNIKRIKQRNKKIINIKESDCLIDLSPCINIYQKALFFNKYNIDKELDLFVTVNKDLKYLYNDDVRNAPLEQKILYLTSWITLQNRYLTQVDIPYIKDKERNQIIKRLSNIFNKDDEVQRECKIDIKNSNNKHLFYCIGKSDCIKNNTIYVIKYVKELSHIHYLECVTYMIGFNMTKGILINTRNNEVYEITIKEKNKLLDNIVRCITKRDIDEWY